MEAWLAAVKLGVVLVVGAVVAVYVLFPMVRGLRQPLGRDFERPGPQAPKAEGPEPSQAEPQGPPEARKIVEMARKDPARTAQLVRKWLKEKET